MRNISDEKLMAYVDGELTGAERVEVEAALEDDPVIESRMAVFEATRTQLAGLYDDAMRRPVPDHLVDLILSGSESGVRSKAPVSSWLDRIGVRDIFKSFSIFGNGYSAAFAFSLLLLASGFAGWQLKSNKISDVDKDMLASFDQGRILAKGQLSKALDGVASGKKLTWSGDDVSTSSIKPVFTFRTSEGSFCRQYEMSLSTSEGFSGVACRNTDGNWQIRAHMTARPVHDAGSKTVPASGANSTMIDKVVDQLISGDVLGSDEESVVIISKWRGTR